jgi:hypothetical protein
MARRRTVLQLAGLVPAAVLVGACRPGVPPATGAAEGPTDLLLVETGDGLVQVDARNGRAVGGPRPGSAAWDGSSYATAVRVGKQTRLEVLDRAGERRYAVDLAGAMQARVVSPSGLFVALTTAEAPGDTYRPSGRDETTIVVADHSGERHRLRMPGCVEPEAFSTSGEHLYVLDYLPPERPDRYRVRMVELATGALQPLHTRDKRVIPPGGEEEMRGEGRQAVYSGDARGLLFTLYVHQADHQHTRDLLASGARDDAPDVHAFVHTLSLSQSFAYCIDLPAPFGKAPARSHAIAYSAPTGDPYVVETASGTVAHLSGQDLTVVRTARIGGIDQGFADASTSAVVSPDGERLFIGTGTRVRVLRTAGLAPVAEWTVTGPVRGVAASERGERLWVGQAGGAVALDPASGRVLARVPVSGLVRLGHVTAAS